jgi:outer membrane protein OmpA-like peptidoglycan-associated protein
MKNYLPPAWLVLAMFVNISAVAQDFRASQYMSAPMLLNPALTGNYSGTSYRLQGLYSHLSNDSGKNTVQNISIDQHFGKDRLWAFGINYMRSGDPAFPMYGNYLGFAVSRGIYLDKPGKHQLRGGIQASYLQAGYDASKGAYQRSMDVSVLKYYPNHMAPGFKQEASYWNLSVGINYKLAINRFQFETGISTFNVTNPRGWNIMPQSYFRKRYRMSILTSFSYAVNPNNTYRLEQYSWKEGLYLRNYQPELEGSSEINESTLGLTWLRTTEKPWSFGLYTRGWKSAYGILNIGFSKTFSMAVSYELPMHKSYYNVTHIEVSAAVIPFNKKSGKKIRPLPDDEADNKYSNENGSENSNSNGNGNGNRNGNGNYSGNATYKLPFLVLQQIKEDTITVVARRSIQYIDDRDGDGILNEFDQCPDVFGSLYNAGCPLGPDISGATKSGENKWVVPDVKVKSIYFEYDASDFTKNGLVLANQVVDFLKINTEYNIYLLGLASKEGRFDYNMKLSRKRAITVASYLMSLGIDGKRILTSYAGNKLAVINSGSRESRWPDRKVVISIKSPFDQ